MRIVKGYLDFKNLESFIDKEKRNGGLKESIVIVCASQLISFFGVAISMIIGAFFVPEIVAYLSAEMFGAFIIFAIFKKIMLK